MLIAAGTLLEGKYRIDRLLGAGGMGSVWIGEHMLLQRRVAVKVLDKGVATSDLSAATRFLREAQTSARLRHDHIVDVLDVGKFEDGTPFLVMELLEGETLSGRIEKGPLSQSDAALLIDQLLAGLGAAHVAGVIHRDIKPDNCFIIQKNGRDHLKLLDFGISKVTAAEGSDDKRMTKTGVVMGTPYYMAPEQARGAKEIDHRCDLYAAAAILYECVTGNTPFEAESVNELLFKIVLEPVVPPRARGARVDEAFEGVILRGMGREPEQRFQRADDFRAALAPFLRSQSGATVVVVSSMLPPSGGKGAPSSIEAVSGIGETAPLDQRALSDAIASARTQGMSGAPPGLSTGPTPPLEVGARESTPAKRRSGAVIALAAAAMTLMVGGGVYLARSDRAATPEPPTAGKTQDKSVPAFSNDVQEEKAAAPKPKPIATTEPSAIASAKSSAPAVAPVGPGPKKPAPTASVTTVPIPAPTATAAPTATSPRPIDTAL